MTTLPITEKSRVEEWNTIITTAINNGYPKQMIYNLRRKLTNRITHKEMHEREKQKKKRITFTFYSPAIRRITNLFKDTNIKIAFRTTNSIQQQLSTRKSNQSGIYKIQCNTCNKTYIGQTGS